MTDLEWDADWSANREHLVVRASRIPNESERAHITDALRQHFGGDYYLPRSWFATGWPHTHAYPVDHPEAVRIKRDENAIVARKGAA